MPEFTPLRPSPNQNVLEPARGIAFACLWGNPAAVPGQLWDAAAMADLTTCSAEHGRVVARASGSPFGGDVRGVSGMVRVGARPTLDS